MRRWTEDTKKIAIEMIKSGCSNEEVSLEVGMSNSSVSLLKYSSVMAHDERVECQICHKEYRQITHKHLREKHGIELEDYIKTFPNADMMTKRRKDRYKSFESPNKGKTYEEIYGRKEAQNKKNKISEKQIGRAAPKFAGTGITGTRRDTNTYARSTYEANVDRIFILEGKRYIDELSSDNKRFDLYDDGNYLTYQPDRVDVDGLFEKGAYLEIKGYMYPKDWKKIQLFRDRYRDKKLIVVCPDEKYCNVNYTELKKKYKDLIPLWEGEKLNYKTRPDLYKIGYKTPEYVRCLNENYPNHITTSIVDGHELFIAKKCLNFNRVRLGTYPYVDSVKLISISDRKPTSNRKSSGEYNYELWEIVTIDFDIADQTKKVVRKFYITNQSKTVDFYCYCQDKFNEISAFFINNCNISLCCGKK